MRILASSSTSCIFLHFVYIPPQLDSGFPVQPLLCLCELRSSEQWQEQRALEKADNTLFLFSPTPHKGSRLVTDVVAHNTIPPLSRPTPHCTLRTRSLCTVLDHTSPPVAGLLIPVMGYFIHPVRSSFFVFFFLFSSLVDTPPPPHTHTPQTSVLPSNSPLQHYLSNTLTPFSSTTTSTYHVRQIRYARCHLGALPLPLLNCGCSLQPRQPCELHSCRGKLQDIG